MKKTAAIIVAAGGGRRFGAVKQIALLAGQPVLEWTLQAFDQHREIDKIILVLREELEHRHYRRRFAKLSAVVPGGKERQDSVRAGFAELRSATSGIVLIHDGVRPLIREDLISQVIAEAECSGAAVPIVPIEDTIKRVENSKILGTMDRKKLFRVQTPQGFQYDILKAALTQGAVDNICGTDEAALVERLGKEVTTVSGDPENLKITGPGDLKIAEVLLEDQIRNRL